MTMVEVNTAELSGVALDWAVGKADGRHIWLGDAKVNGLPMVCDDLSRDMHWSPSDDWRQGGLLIHKYRPDIQTNNDGQIAAYLNNSLSDPEPLAIGRGDTYLVATCRAIVAAKLGDSVMIPAELLEVVE